MKKIISIVGTRPNFIKCSVLDKGLKNYNHVIINTFQHYNYNMNIIFCRDMKVKYNLKFGNNKKEEIKEILNIEKPDLILVYGDCNCTIQGARAKMNIPLVHIEAGLRSFNREMSEEINRIIVDELSDYLFCPTDQAIKNLKKEKVNGEIIKTGDISVEIVKEYKEKLKGMIFYKKHDYYLATLHRPYNVDNKEKLNKILSMLSSLKKQIIFPLHPRTEKNIIKEYKNIKFIQPVDFLKMLNLILGARKVITDSGGLQKEAYLLEKPLLILRPETEWVEIIQEGCGILITEKDKEKIKKFNPVNFGKNIFGKNVLNKMVKEIDKILR